MPVFCWVALELFLDGCGQVWPQELQLIRFLLRHLRHLCHPDLFLEVPHRQLLTVTCKLPHNPLLGDYSNPLQASQRLQLMRQALQTQSSKKGFQFVFYPLLLFFFNLNTYEFLTWTYFNRYCVSTKCVTPWDNRNGWLGVKHQINYLLTYSVRQHFHHLTWSNLSTNIITESKQQICRNTHPHLHHWKKWYITALLPRHHGPSRVLRLVGLFILSATPFLA